MFSHIQPLLFSFHFTSSFQLVKVKLFRYLISNIRVFFGGKYYHNTKNGNYYCAACGALLFTSGTKYNSGSGWPSFYAPASNKNIIEVRDTSHGMERIEIKCAHCGSHLGHLFPDGPHPTGLRYCVNSLALDFEEKPPEEKGKSER